MTGAHKTAGLSLKANKLYTMGTSTENPSILETTGKSTTVVRAITIPEKPHQKPMLQSYQEIMNCKVKATTSIHNQTPIRVPILIGHLFFTMAMNILRITRRQMPSLLQRTYLKFLAKVFKIANIPPHQFHQIILPAWEINTLPHWLSQTWAKTINLDTIFKDGTTPLQKCGLTVKGKPMTFALIPAVLVTLIDREFLSHVATTACIQTSGLVTVNSIASSEMTYEYVRLDLWFKGLLNGKPATTYIQREARVVNNLKAKLLVGMDVLGPEKIDLLFTSEKMVINSCKGLVVLITTTSRTGQPVKQNVQTVKKVLIEPHTLAKVPIQLWGTAELPDQTLMF